MNYQQRITTAASLATDFLRQYQRPSHLDEEGCLREIAAIAEELNSLVSASLSPDAFKTRIEAAFRHLRKTYTMRQWPMPAHFVKAMEATTPRTDDASQIASPVDDKERLIAQRMMEGEAVGDGWLYGRGAVKLLREGLVTQGVMKQYRSALYFGAKDVGGQEYADRLEAKLLRRHDEAVALDQA